MTKLWRSWQKLSLTGVHRAGDCAARRAGDEIALILYNTSISAGRVVAENICAAVERDSQEIGGNILIWLTVSAEIHACIPQEHKFYTLDDFISDTAAAVEHAKKTGGNKVSAFSEINC